MITLKFIHFKWKNKSLTTITQCAATWMHHGLIEITTLGECNSATREQTVAGHDIWLLLTCVEAVEGWRYSLGLTATVVAILSCCSGKHTDTAESDSGCLWHLFSVVRLFKDITGHSYKTETDLRKTSSVMSHSNHHMIIKHHYTN